MNIRDSIRRAVTEDIKAKRYNKWDSDSQSNIYALDTFLRKSGYRLMDILPHEGKYELVIEAIKEDHYHPAIFHDVEENQFYVKIVDHGMLISSDVEEIIKGYENALSILRYLDRLDIDKLEFEG